MTGAFSPRLVGHAQPAAEIQMADGMPCARSAEASASTLSTASSRGAGIENLRADVAAHPFGRQVGKPRRVLVNRLRIRDGDAELVLAAIRWRCKDG